MPKRATILDSSQYSALLKDVRALLSDAKSRPSEAKLRAYWSIGKRISAQRISGEAGYLQSIFRDLASDAGLAQRTLYDVVQFFEAYQKPPLDSGISWTHHRALLRLSRKKDRAFYAKIVREKKWSTRQLEAAIARGLHEGKEGVDRFLTRPTAPNYIYAAELHDVIDADTLDLSLDLGFGVLRRLRIRLADIDAPELLLDEGRLARNFVVRQLMGARTIVVKSVKFDLHGRYLAHLFFARRNLSVAECFSSGIYLNDLLLREKHAVAFD